MNYTAWLDTGPTNEKSGLEMEVTLVAFIFPLVQMTIFFSHRLYQLINCAPKVTFYKDTLSFGWFYLAM